MHDSTSELRALIAECRFRMKQAESSEEEYIRCLQDLAAFIAECGYLTKVSADMLVDIYQELNDMMPFGDRSGWKE